MKIDKYKKAISVILDCNPKDIFLYWKGRVALYAILKAMNIGKGDEVILPAFTCVVVPNAILYLGAVPVYVDIEKKTYNMDISKVDSAITKKTKAIISQNTFGLTSNLESLLDIAAKFNLFTIEDCAHGFGGFYKGKPNGAYCDAAFFSTQWNKPYSTGVGGILLVNKENLKEKVQALESSKINASLSEKFSLSILLLLKRLLIHESTYYRAINVYRYFSRKNFVVGSNELIEISNIVMPNNYFKNISDIQVSAGLKSLKNLAALNKLRKENARVYNGFLKRNNKVSISDDLITDHLFLKFPLLVSDRESFFQLARKANVILGDWFLSPIHPVKRNLTFWKFEANKFPNAVYISEHIVNLPTEVKNTDKIIQFLTKNLDLVL
jgi:dTDP-4-amino-4,6-dideoxygalactose transaminase